MAMILITVQDLNDGVEVKLSMEPATPGSLVEFTPAQRMAAVALNAIEGAIQQEAPALVLPPEKKIVS
jgi:hypothetical protein